MNKTATTPTEWVMPVPSCPNVRLNDEQMDALFGGTITGIASRIARLANNDTAEPAEMERAS